MKKIYFIIIILFIGGVFLVLQNGIVGDFFQGENKTGQITEVKGVADGQEKFKKNQPVLNLLNKQTIVKNPIRKNGVSDLVVPRAHSSIILDVDSGAILHYNKGKDIRQIASLTKIMTAIIVVEKIANLDDEIIEIDEEAVFAEGTKIGCPRSGYCNGERLKVGEKISARELLTAMLVNSTNDAAIALAKHIAGSQESFAKLMNKKAKSLGLKDTHFCTPSGLEIDGQESQCYSSAYDIARIAVYSMKYKTIWDTFKIQRAEIQSADGKYSHEVASTNRLLKEMEGCLGGKTGFTPLAGRCLMMATEDKNGHKVLAVILNNPYRWQDIRTMFEWVFNSYVWE